MKNAIVLAAGLGTRMKSNLTKVMHPLVNKPIIGHIIDKLEGFDLDHIVVIVGYQGEKIEAYLQDRVEYAHQEKQRGTGDAIRCVESLRGLTGDTLILYGDVPLLSPLTIEALLTYNEDRDLTMVTVHKDDPGHYGRVVRNGQGEIEKIVEARDCNEHQLLIKEVSAGLFCIKNEQLFKYVDRIERNPIDDSFDFSDIVELMSHDGLKIKAIRAENEIEVVGINDRWQLAQANQWLQTEVNKKHMMNGVTFINPEQSYVGMDVELAEDVVIYPNVHLRGKTIVHTGTIIYADSWLENAEIGRDSKINASRITDSQVGNEVTVGPYAHIRMNSVVADHNRVGNFVELKNTNLGASSRVAHLTYLGDSDVGEDVNIGCGVVTANYDGKNKHRTVIGDHAFIGSNCNLIAPVTVGEYALTAAGSTITEDVPAAAMGIARARQVNKENFGAAYIKKEKK